MNKYELNNLGSDWVWEAETPEEATEKYIRDVCGAEDLAEYVAYCQDLDIAPRIQWNEIT